MTSTQPVHIPREGAPHLWWAFAIIIGGFILASVVSIREIHNAQTDVRLISENALSSIDLASRVSRNLYKKRLLLETHIFEKDIQSMQPIERELADVDARLTEAFGAYGPIAAEKDEHAAWRQLPAAVAAVQPHVDRILALSRENRDEQAQAIMKSIEPRLEKLNDDADTLLHLNRARAQGEVGAIRTLQFEAIIVQVVLAVAWTAFALLTARLVTRLIRDRERQMRLATTMLEERNRELDAFAGRVAHDLRGPLTTVNLASTMLDSGCLPQEASGALRRGVTQMEAIIQALLTLSRISAQTETESSQTADVATSLEEDLKPKVEAVGGRLRVQVSPAVVRCNAGLLRQALWNLAENAVKYRRYDVQFELEINGEIVRHAYELNVADNGKGMSATDARQAFEPFFRGEQVGGIPGTGLGMSIVKRAVEVSGGSVSVHSVPGQGTTVKIQLPLAASKAA